MSFTLRRLISASGSVTKIETQNILIPINKGDLFLSTENITQEMYVLHKLF